MSEDNRTASSVDTIRPQDRERLNAIARACRQGRESAWPRRVETAAHLLAIFTLCAAAGAAGSPAICTALIAGAACWGFLGWHRLMWLAAVDDAVQSRVPATACGIRDPRSIGRLLDLSRETSGPEREHVLAIAARLALSLDEPTAAALAPAQLDLLCRLLAPPSRTSSLGPGPYERRVAVALLRLMATRGHQPARSVAPRVSRSWAAPEVREAAEACLARLDKLQAEASIEDTLLRPADAPAGDTLLRPAEPVPEEQLLRPSDGDGA